MKPRKTAAPSGPTYPMQIETFREIGFYERSQWTQAEPSCFNGSVRVRRYRVTIEEIDEPVEVICARLQKMWDECDNHHHHAPLEAAARKYGYDLRERARKEPKT